MFFMSRISHQSYSPNLTSKWKAIFFVILLETLSFLNLSAELALVVSSLRIALVGLALILILRFLPNGLLREKPTII